MVARLQFSNRLKKDFRLIPEFHLAQFYARLCTQFPYIHIVNDYVDGDDDDDVIVFVYTEL